MTRPTAEPDARGRAARDDAGHGAGDDAAAWAERFFAAIDTMDPDRPLPFFHPDAAFGFNGTIQASGIAGIRQFIAAFYGAITGLRHDLLDTWRAGDTVIVRGTVHYTVGEKGTCSTGFVGCFAMEAGTPAGMPERVRTYLPYVDTAPLQALLAA